MNRHGDIYPKICTMENLREAHANARKDKLFYQEVKMVDADPDTFLKEKYIVPIVPSLIRYYEEVIAAGKKNKAAKIRKYKKKLEKKGLVKAA